MGNCISPIPFPLCWQVKVTVLVCLWFVFSPSLFTGRQGVQGLCGCTGEGYSTVLVYLWLILLWFVFFFPSSLADKEYRDFVAALEKGVEHLPSAEVQLEQREEAEKATSGGGTAQHIAS